MLVLVQANAVLIHLCKGSHLVFTGPESADGELHLVPLASLGARDIPHSAALGAPVDPDVDLQVPGAVAVAAVQEVAELDAVGVVLAEREQEQLSPLAPEMLRGIDHHEGPWKGKMENKDTLEDYNYFFSSINSNTAHFTVK